MEYTDKQLKYAFLRCKQGLSLDEKIYLTQKRVWEWVREWGQQVYVSVSGSDSLAVLALARDVWPSIPALYVDTGLEYPEVREVALSQKNVTRVRPDMPFTQVIKQYGYPVLSKRNAQYIHEVRTAKNPNTPTVRLRLTGMREGRGFSEMSMIPKKWQYLIRAPFKIHHGCCAVMKKKPFQKYAKETGRVALTGVRADEGKQREMNYLKFGCNAFDTATPLSSPIAFWTDQDVLAFHRREGTRLPSVYGDIVEDCAGRLKFSGVERTGCVFCAFGCHLEDSPNRFQRLYESHPSLHKYCMEQLGMEEVLRWYGIPWLPGQSKPAPPLPEDMLGPLFGEAI